MINETPFPHQTLEKITNAKIVITSDLKRSIESAKFLNSHIKIISDPVFREAELPVPERKLWGLKLPPGIWSIIMRCLWYKGYSNQCESYGKAKERAKRAVKKLLKYAEKHQTVALVGHGFFNMLVAKELRNQRWKGNKKFGTKHWSCSTYCFIG